MSCILKSVKTEIVKYWCLIRSTNKLNLLGIFTAFLLSQSVITKSLADETSYQNYDVGGATLKLAIPPSYCMMDKTFPADKMALTAMTKGLRGRNELLAQYSNCKELTEWRKGGNAQLAHKGTYQVSTKLKTIDLTGKENETVKNICQFISSKTPNFAETAEALEQTFNRIPPNQGKKIGIATNEDNLCIAVTVLRLENNNKKIEGQISLYATSVIKGRLLYSYLYANGHKLNEIMKLIEEMKQIHQLNVKANI